MNKLNHKLQPKKKKGEQKKGKQMSNRKNK